MENPSDCTHERVQRWLVSRNVQSGEPTYQHICSACRAYLGHEPCGQYLSYGVPVTPITAAYFDSLNDGVISGVDQSSGKLPYHSDFGVIEKPFISLLSQSSWMGPDGGVCAGPVIVHADYERMTGEKPPEGSIMADPTDEDTSKLDLELVANELEAVAKLAGRLHLTDQATEIGALVAKYREQAKGMEG